MTGLLSFDFVTLSVLARREDPQPVIQRATAALRLHRVGNDQYAHAHTYAASGATSVPVSAPVSADQPADRTPVDPIVVRQASLGDEHAFAALVRWYHPRFLRFARHMLHHDADADDAVQEAFIRVYRALPHYRERERFESWLFRILANCCRTALTRTRRHTLRLIGLETGEAQEAYNRTDGRNDTAWHTLLDAAMESLPAEQREAFLLHHIEGYSYDVMSDITGVRRSALKMRVKRASDQLRAFLGDTSHA